MVRTLHFLCRNADSSSAGGKSGKYSLVVEHGPFKPVAWVRFSVFPSINAPLRELCYLL